MNSSLGKWPAHKQGLLNEKEYENNPDLFGIEEAISEGWKLKFDYQEPDGKSYEGLDVQPNKITKLNNKILIHGYCDQWEKEWYFRLTDIIHFKYCP